ncbi:MAG: hypothetical protein GXO10_07065, partial [Crenarchaeota archaeon]|nr:hypothetical protein [Thermoproteota archaeon]
KVTYRYSHVVTVKTLALVPLPSVSSSNVTYSTKIENIEVSLSAPTVTAFSKKLNEYYIYYVNKRTNIKVPVTVDAKEHIDYYGQELSVEYVCNLYNVTNGKIVSKNEKYATIQVNTNRDIQVKVYYKCRPITPIPYLKQITCNLENTKALVSLLIENLGGKGNITLTVRPGNITRTVKLTNKPASLTFTAPGPTSSIAVLYHGIVIGVCTKIKVILIPIPENTSTSELVKIIEKSLRSGKVPRYVVPSNIAKGFIVIVPSKNIKNVEELEINSTKIPCRKAETINNQVIYICKPNTKKPIKIGHLRGYISIIAKTKNGNKMKYAIPQESISSKSQKSQIEITKVITGWFDANHLEVIIFTKNVLPNTLIRAQLVEKIGNNYTIITEGEGRVNSSGIAFILLPINNITALTALVGTKNKLKLNVTAGNSFNTTNVIVRSYSECRSICEGEPLKINNAQIVLELPEGCSLGKEMVICLPYTEKTINITPG